MRFTCCDEWSERESQTLALEKYLPANSNQVKRPLVAIRLFQQQSLSADDPDGSGKFRWVVTSVVICKFRVATDNYLFNIQGRVLAFPLISFVTLKTFVVEVYFTRTALDNDVTATV
jgi:hypothetical protein